ncbi:MAG: type III secretion system export apparatus subunit SctT [Hyphomicrobiales bacterium]|nr:type III secretion system export apparatus subunit SctT [Hyphomicrobiales bacterium]
MEQLKPFVDIVFLYLTALALALPRPLAILSILPVMTRLGLPQFLRTVVSIAISVPIVLSLVSDPAAREPVSSVSVFFICLKEVVLGILIGLVISVPFWVAEAAGNILDLLRQAPDAQMQDPQGTTESSITGTLLSLFIILYFVVMDGLTVIVGLVYSSYDIWPVMQMLPPFDAAAGFKLIALLDTVLKSAFLLAAPLIIFILIAFFILMMIARFAPQTNVFDLSMSFSNVAFFVMLQIYTMYVLDYLPNTLEPIKSTLSTVQEFFK